MSRKVRKYNGILAGAVASAAVVGTLGVSGSAYGQVTVGIDPTQPWIGYMNWFTLNGTPGNYSAGGYMAGSPWGTGGLDASFTGSQLTLSPSTAVAPTGTNVGYWWSSATNPAPLTWMDASMYVQNDALAGDDVTFTGDIAADGLTGTSTTPNGGYISQAFIKDFNSSYQVVGQSTYQIYTNELGDFSISLQTNPGDHIQYGFETQGPIALPGSVNPTIVIDPTPVPEPVSLGLFGAAIPLLLRRRKA